VTTTWPWPAQWVRFALAYAAVALVLKPQPWSGLAVLALFAAL
jgi:hypothetical protein